MLHQQPRQVEQYVGARKQGLGVFSGTMEQGGQRQSRVAGAGLGIWHGHSVMGYVAKERGLSAGGVPGPFGQPGAHSAICLEDEEQATRQ